MKLLESIRGPEDLRGLTGPEMTVLAAEIREEIIKTVAATGGHLAPSLGTVELAIALHTVFQSPKDKIIWDVGHQSYAHKLLTGRLAAFATLRLPGGISGFPRRAESPHDPFGTGHASTSISAALGFAAARDIQGGDFTTVAVIGDGAMTGGLAFEALNNAGHKGTDLIVVLNDNSMSIAPNVGALSLYLTRLRTDPTYSRLKSDVEHLLRAIPRIGEAVAKAAERLKDSLRHLLVPGAFFEALGFKYLGPIDGHNLPLLQSVLQSARDVGGPVLVHCITKKGKGYPPAEEKADLFHGLGPFDRETGLSVKRAGKATFSQVFGETVLEMARRDARVVAITAAMPEGTGLSAFAREFKDRFFDVGIAEGHAVTFAGALAAQGLRPVVAIYSTFLQRAYDQLIHDVALQNLPVIFAVDRSGLVGDDGATHQGAFDLAYLRLIPGMTVLAPRDEKELAAALPWALTQDGPVAIRYPRGAGAGDEAAPCSGGIKLGQGEILRQGADGAILAIGPSVYAALEAAEVLARERLEVAVADLRFAKPLDGDLVEELARTRRLVTVEEGILAGGVGAQVLEELSRRGKMGVRVVNLGLPDRFLEQGNPGEQRRELSLDPEGIATAVRESMAIPFERQGGVKIGRSG